MKIIPLGIEHKSLIKEYFYHFPPEISEHTFTNLFVWRKFRPVYFIEVQESLLLLIDKENAAGAGKKILFGPPVGTLSAVTAIDTFQDIIDGAVRLPAGEAAELTAAGYPVQADQDNADYVYRVDDLAGLAGRRYAKKRNQIKKCLRAYQCTYEPLTPNIIPDCVALQKRWCAGRSCSTDPGLCAEYTAILSLFAHFTELGLLGGVVRVDGEVQAFAVAERLGPETAVWHFEKNLPGIQGLGQLINQWFARHALSDFSFVNREQDLGVPGLRQAKKSYHPHHMVEKYTLSPAAGGPECKEIVADCAGQ